MNQDDHSIHARDIINSQVGQILTNCTNTISQQPPGERKKALEALDEAAKDLIAKLPEEKQQKAAAKSLERAVEVATSEEPDREWYSLSAKGLIEASKFVKDFSGHIAGTLLNLGKTLWSDFSLPELK